MIGIIGYGMVGKAVEHGFCFTPAMISDPLYNRTTVSEMCAANPDAIFVCVPTPTDDTDYSLLRGVLQTIKDTGYAGLTVVKSTVLPKYIEEFNVIYNPEFLSRATAFDDFVNPPLVIIGGNRASELLALYELDSQVDTSNTFITDVKTAALAKYTMNSFYALKVTFMNSMHDVAQEMGVEWNEVTMILEQHPWMGTHHYQVPGPDGLRGFGGPCLPKDTEALVKDYKVELLEKVLALNTLYRQKENNGN